MGRARSPLARTSPAWWEAEEVFCFEAGPRDGEALVALTAARQRTIVVPDGSDRRGPHHRYVEVRGTNRYRWVHVAPDPVDGWVCSCSLDVAEPADPACPCHRWTA